MNVYGGKNESAPTQADSARVRPARVVEMGTQQVCQQHQG